LSELYNKGIINYMMSDEYIALVLRRKVEQISKEREQGIVDYEEQ